MRLQVTYSATSTKYPKRPLLGSIPESPRGQTTRGGCARHLRLLGPKGKVVTVIVRNYVNNIDHSCSSNYITMSNTDNSRNYRIQVYWLRARNCGVELMVVGFLGEERQARRETKRDDTFDD